MADRPKELVDELVNGEGMLRGETECDIDDIIEEDEQNECEETAQVEADAKPAGDEEKEIDAYVEKRVDGFIYGFSEVFLGDGMAEKVMDDDRRHGYDAQQLEVGLSLGRVGYGDGDHGELWMASLR